MKRKSKEITAPHHSGIQYSIRPRESQDHRSVIQQSSISLSGDDQSSANTPTWTNDFTKNNCSQCSSLCSPSEFKNRPYDIPGQQDSHAQYITWEVG